MTRAIVDVRDVSRLHAESLQQANNIVVSLPAPPGRGRIFQGLSGRTLPRSFKATKRVTVLGEQKSIPLGISASDTELAFGWKIMDLEQTITNLISHYIELR
ncbi:hypothetical protein VN97_g11730 [Penicillium thymicola]|uniref:Uncharacterized protein n=1 Tax=Penicillium thymicola TaxID=293382 RepID=A0AAI9T7J3_PENTH|nr:hypothetical protein VN97_g11730 [Penicillium thymicola]